MRNHYRILGTAFFLLIAPVVALAQGSGPVSVQVAAGGQVNVPGNNQSISIGFWPAERVGLLVGVERIHMPTEVETFPGGGVSATRGGTTTFVSGELRVRLLGGDGVAPYALAGGGAGTAKLNVNETFPDPQENRAALLFFGGGVDVPVGGRLSLFGDVRFVLQVERDESGVFLFVPIRGGIAWRF